MEKEVDEKTGEIIDIGTLAVLQKGEIDSQVATAKQYPRSVKRFQTEALELATLNEEIANECLYALPRDGKTIEGPSARLAEIIASSWGNCRAGARVIEEGKEFVTAQGIFQDVEKNVVITYEVKRRIVDKHGRRYKPDMIGVTANAACSVALRNAVFKGIPKALWKNIYDSVRKIVAGDSKTLANRRAEALQYLQKLGATQEMVCKTLGVAGIEDIGLDELVTLKGIATAIKEGETTVEQAFSVEKAETKTAQKTEALKEQLKTGKKKEEPKPEQPQFSEFEKKYFDVLAAINDSEKKEDLEQLQKQVDENFNSDLTTTTEEEYKKITELIEKKKKELR